MTLSSIPNPDFVTLYDNKARWDLPDHRRHGFHNLHTTLRYGMSLRAPGVLPLRKEVDWTIGERSEVARFLAMPHFSAFVVVRDARILYESYAPDFGARQAASPHVYHQDDNQSDARPLRRRRPRRPRPQGEGLPT
ncbi:hypothetical protein NKJ87_28810 [Mesorhizobium sp. M0027]|uniref:hypothetical protein n=1 Tax=Mesorhizobium sp. M0027 TaxID=2956848 RepID=UPI00333DF231